MTDEAIASAKADIESTTDLLERALKLSGLITSLFAERGFKLVVVARSWLVCGLYVDMLGVLETESTKPNRELEMPYGTISIIPPELALVELGLDVPSRRPFGHDDRLCAAFGGLRAPSFA